MPRFLHLHGARSHSFRVRIPFLTALIAHAPHQALRWLFRLP